MQYKHPHIGAKRRRVLCAKAKVAKGKGALKPVPATKWQGTPLYIYKVVEEEKGERGDVTDIQQPVGEDEQVRTDATKEPDSMQQHMEEEENLVRCESTEEDIMQKQCEEGEPEGSEDEIV